MNSYSSENEDDPEAKSDSDTTKVEKRRSKRRCSRQMKRTKTDNLSSEDEVPVTTRKKNTRKSRGRPSDVSKQPYDPEKLKLMFRSGKFVIAKEEARKFDATKPSIIWRIDGKALLQKFEPFTEEGELKYKNTSIYTGWSILESEKYMLLKDIKILSNNNNKLVLTFNPIQLKSCSIDSD